MNLPIPRRLCSAPIGLLASAAALPKNQTPPQRGGGSAGRRCRPRCGGPHGGPIDRMGPAGLIGLIGLIDLIYLIGLIYLIFLLYPPHRPPRPPPVTKRPPLRPPLNSLAMTLVAVLAAAGVSAQDAYPSRTVTIVVPTVAAGTTDLSARMLAQALAPVLGQSVVVDNRGGGGGSIAATAVKRAAPDGYTLLMQYSGYHVLTPLITPQKHWEHAAFHPLANVLSPPQIIVVPSSLPVKTLADLIAYAKAHPGKLNYASAGTGSLQHVTGVMLE